MSIQVALKVYYDPNSDGGKHFAAYRILRRAGYL